MDVKINFLGYLVDEYLHSEARRILFMEKLEKRYGSKWGITASITERAELNKYREDNQNCFDVLGAFCEAATLDVEKVILFFGGLYAQGKREELYTRISEFEDSIYKDCKA